MITTDGKTLQQVLDEVATALIKQGGRCLGRHLEGCIYGSGDKHCAIGWLLPEDDHDLMDYEGSIMELAKDRTELGPNDKFIRKYLVLLTNLQGLHDEPSVVNRQNYYIALGEDFDLDMTAWQPWVAMAPNA